MALDNQGNLLAMDDLRRRVCIFQSDGKLLTWFGIRCYCENPRRICVDPYRRIYVGNLIGEIGVFGFGSSCS